jgi:hypothetical protein
MEQDPASLWEAADRWADGDAPEQRARLRPCPAGSRAVRVPKRANAHLDRRGEGAGGSELPNDGLDPKARSTRGSLRTVR